MLKDDTTFCPNSRRENEFVCVDLENKRDCYRKLLQNTFSQIIPYMVTYVTTCSMSIVVWKVKVVQEIFI